MKQLFFFLLLLSCSLLSFSYRLSGQVPDITWAKSFGGTEWEVGHGIGVDAAGNSYVTGQYGSSFTIAGTTITPNWGVDIFVIKLDANGEPLWAKALGALGGGMGYDIAVDPAGNSYVTGWFEGPLTAVPVRILSGMSTPTLSTTVM